MAEKSAIHASMGTATCVAVTELCAALTIDRVPGEREREEWLQLSMLPAMR